IRSVISDPLGILKEVGKNIMRGLWQGITWIWDHVIKPGFARFTKLIPSWIKGPLGIASPSKVMMGLGEDTMLGFALGLKDTDLVEKNSGNLALSAVTSMQDALNKASVAAANMDEFDPTITPVLDLTKVQ